MDNSFLHSKRLLLVDDEQELLKMVSDILKDAGFETVLTAMSVKSCSDHKRRKPRFNCFGCHVPDGDGFALMQQLRTFSSVPIIFLTAKKQSIRQTIGLGAWGRRLHFKALYATGIITAYLCGAAPNL